MDVVIQIMVFIDIIGLLFLLYLYRKKQVEKYNSVILNSEKIKKVKKLNQDYKFKNVKENMILYFDAKTKKKFDSFTYEKIIEFLILDEENGLKNEIDNSVFNLKLYSEYEKKYIQIINNNCVSMETLEQCNMTKDEFERIESKNVAYLKLMKKHQYLNNVNVIVFYNTPTRKYHYEKSYLFDIFKLVSISEKLDTIDKNKYNIKMERELMTDSLRYDILMRDKFRCQICGATQDDGVKLHIDHIIPVSKGGKTEVSNLRTLCERCNLGKSNKIEKI